MSAAVSSRPVDVARELHFGDCGPHEWSDDSGSSSRGCAVILCTRNRPAMFERFLISLSAQEPRPRQLVVVDASDDTATETALSLHLATSTPARCVDYFRVYPAGAGVTRQRNFALARVRCDLVASFDDDIVLLAGCLAELEKAHRANPRLVGVGARVDNEPAGITLAWRLRRLLLVVPSLAPGRYFDSGVSTPWGWIPPGPALMPGDWLPGGAVMWKTAAARAIGYAEYFDGYACGNDLEFSLRMRRLGTQALAASAHLLHLQDGGGRPDPRRLAFEALRNRIYIQRVCGDRRLSRRLWFAYGMAVETGLQALHLLHPGRTRHTLQYLRGVADCLREQLSQAAASWPGGPA